jgi:hypothetical protein
VLHLEFYMAERHNSGSCPCILQLAAGPFCITRLIACFTSRVSRPPPHVFPAAIAPAAVAAAAVAVLGLW